MREILQDKLNAAIYHKCRRLRTNTGELECMTWDVMRNFFYIDLSYCKKDFRNLS